jgi:hypothetical protein
MELDRLGAEEEGTGSLAVRRPACDSEGDLELLRCELFGGCGVSTLGCFTAGGE